MKGLEEYSKIVNGYDPSKNLSLSLMTKYEFNQLVSLRMLQLSKGAPPLLDEFHDLQIRSNTELRAVAVKELLAGRLPYMVKRDVNGKTEYWRIRDMDLTAVRALF